MPKKKSQSRRPFKSRRASLAGVNPLVLVEQLEDHFVSTASPYWKLYEKTKATSLDDNGPEALGMAKLLDNVDAAIGVEDAIRWAGFVLGFNACRQLLLGELALPAPRKAGAR